MRALIIDDEPHCISALQYDLAMFCPGVTVVGSCSSAKEGLIAIRRHKPDLIFLDVEMPWMNGFEMLEILGEELSFQVIFTTAYSQFAARAFRVSAVDYLLKPVDSEELQAAIGKLRPGRGIGSDPNLENMVRNTRVPVTQQRIAVPSREGYEFVLVLDILYCRAEGAYTHMMLAGGRKILLSRALGEVADLLPDELFERAHHSVLVNIREVAQFRKTGGSTIVMSNGDELGISKSKKELVMERLGIR